MRVILTVIDAYLDRPALLEISIEALTHYLMCLRSMGAPEDANALVAVESAMKAQPLHAALTAACFRSLLTMGSASGAAKCSILVLRAIMLHISDGTIQCAGYITYI